ncbi:ATP-dependent RNA helicase RhlE, partial [Escherichia coli]|nr:ATP-dependent RNA helicase RhlE [Escherichia coli]
AGRSGEAISLVAPDEEKLLKAIERLTKQRIPDGDLQGFDPSTVEAERPEARPPKPERKPRADKPKREPSNGDKPQAAQAAAADGEGKAKKSRKRR